MPPSRSLVLHRLVGEKLKTSSCVKLEGLSLRLSFIKGTYTKIIYIIFLESKMTPPQRLLVLHRLIRRKNFKIFLCETRRHRPLIFGMLLYQSHILYEVLVLPN